MFSQNALIAESEKLQKFSMRLTRNKADADDLFQSTYLRALEKADYFNEGTNLFSWTSKIMYNLFVSDYRRRVKYGTQYDPETFLQKQSIAPSQNVDADLADVKRAMVKLSDDHREIIALICVKGMRYAEVSEMLQIPIGTVRSRLSRARKELQVLMSTPVWRMMPRAPAPKKPVNANRPRIPAYLAARAMQKRVHA